MENLNTLLSYLQTAAAFMVMITVLVAVHELGHYWFARMFGMKVNAFAVMVGGIRKTKLDADLPKRILPSRVVGAGYVLTLIGVVLAALEGWTPVYQVGLFLLAIVFPMWIMTRLTTLYRYPVMRGIQVMAPTYGVALLLLAFGTRGAGLLQTTNLLHYLFYASIVGLLILYYQPLGERPEDAPMGEGAIRDGDEKREVRFRPLACYTNREGTEFSLLALPLGGFAAIHGMHPKPDGSETQIEQGFYSKAPWKRFLVLFAGPLFSILLGAVLLLSAMVIYGERQPINKPIIGEIGPGSPAAVAGLKSGDRVISVEGKPVRTFFEVITQVRDNPGPIDFVIEREGLQKPFEIVPKLDPSPTPVLGADLELTDELKRQYKIGIGMPSEFVRIPIGEAVSRAATVPVAAMQQFGAMLSSPRTAGENLSGPAGVAQATHNASQRGGYELLTLAALLSISLGIMNLLPIPPLDGGQMLVALIEMLRRGKRLSLDVQSRISTVGFMMIMLLMLFVISQDTGRLMNR